MTTCLAVILAAGKGDRYGSAVPKQYLMLAGKPVLRRTVEQFLSHPAITAVQVIIQPEHRQFYDEAMAGLELPEPVMGAGSRQSSTRAGLEVYSQNPPDLVLIHDGVRPLIDAATIDRLVEELATAQAVVPGIAVTDTLRRADATMLCGGTVDRAGLWRMQTPQGFDFATIMAAHRAAGHDAYTDDAAIAEAAGVNIKLVPGSPHNLKITTPDDLAAAERTLQTLDDIRTGQGFDVHEFGPGTSIMICGVAIPHDRTAVGHSDADVGLHALTDAIFGAIGEGDIGTHFPPSDPPWHGADSATFLRHAASLVAARGGVIANADITLLCEQPKVGPHRAAMKARVAEILGIAADRVAVKATTTEKLGFLGRGEGIAAQALATVRLPAA